MCSRLFLLLALLASVFTKTVVVAKADDDSGVAEELLGDDGESNLRFEVADDDEEEGSKDEKKSEDFRFRSRGTGYSRSPHHGYHEEVLHPGVVRTRVTVQKKILRPAVTARRRYNGHGLAGTHHAVLPGGDFEGSYVAVSGRPGERTIHKVNGRGSVASEFRKTMLRQLTISQQAIFVAGLAFLAREARPETCN